MAIVRDRQDAQQMRDAERELRKQTKHEHVSRAAEIAAPAGAGSAQIVAAGADRIELDPLVLNTVESELARLHDELTRCLALTQELGGELQDGKSPVTQPMRKAFGLRAGAGPGGVQAALREYLDELAGLREAIRRVRSAHQENDLRTAVAFRAQQAE